jgi:hypothetical protein
MHPYRAESHPHQARGSRLFHLEKLFRIHSPSHERDGAEREQVFARARHPFIVFVDS